MMKQKMVMKMKMKNHKNSCKAMKIAAKFSGLEKVELLGTDKEEIVVTGEGIDSVKLLQLLRKSVGPTDLVSVVPVKEEKAVAATKETKETAAAAKGTKETEARIEYVYLPPPPPPYYGQFMPPIQVVHEDPCYSCNIL